MNEQTLFAEQSTAVGQPQGGTDFLKATEHAFDETSVSDKVVEDFIFRSQGVPGVQIPRSIPPESKGDRTAPAEALEDTLPLSRPTTQTSVIQIWEGVVTAVGASQFSAVIRDRSGNISDHSMTIGAEWIVEQDRDLIREGAVFYLSLFRRSRRGSIENAQEIRFRRLPNWSKEQIKRIRATGEGLFDALHQAPSLRAVD